MYFTKQYNRRSFFFTVNIFITKLRYSKLNQNQFQVTKTVIICELVLQNFKTLINQSNQHVRSKKYLYMCHQKTDP